jgi:hypothetical protein
MRPRSEIYCTVLAALVAGAPARAQTPPNGGGPAPIVASREPDDTSRLVIPRVASDAAVGGRLPATLWDALPVFPMTEHSPRNGAEPSERTEIRIAHDGRYIYFDARMYDREPDGIQAPSLKRNDIPHTNDFFGILLDGFLDRETAHGFYTNPAGLRTDLMTLNDASGSGAFNYDWNAYWDVHSERTEEGWFTQVRVPFSSLRFRPDSGSVTMGLIVYRRIARRNEWITFPAIEQRWGSVSHFKPSNARAVVFEDIARHRLLHFTPYLLAGGERTRPAPEPTAPDQPVATWGAPVMRRALETGLDIKAGVTSNLTLDLTLNPDFAQVEADDQQVNLTRFSIFFPEKRRFFQERSSTFDFQTGQSDRLFYSRRIGLEGSTPVGLYGGARLAGRVGAWDVGALSVQTESLRGHGAGVNHSVLRARRTVLNANSYVGGIVTSQLEGGRYNVAWGADGQLRVSRTAYATLQWAQTFDSDLDAGGIDGAMARTQLERRTNRGLLYDVNAKWVGAAHRPALGFLRQRDYLRLGDRIGWGWTPPSGARYTSQTLELRASALRRNVDGVFESFSAGPNWSLTTPVGFRFSLNGQHQREDLATAFALPGGNSVPAGVHEFRRYGAGFATPGGWLRGITVDVEGGSFYHGTNHGFSITPRAHLGRHFEVRGRYQFDRLRFPDGPGLDAHVARLRLEHQMSVRTAWSGFVQYNSAADAIAANLRLRYSPVEGNDFFIVYNAGLNTLHFDDRLIPLAPVQTLLLKVSLTTRPGS